MSANQALPYPLRLNDEFMNKLKFIAKENGRSVNKEIEILVKNHIRLFENENGSISIDEDS